MKHSFQHYTNEIYLIKANQHFIHRDSGFRQTGYDTHYKKDFGESLHSYIVEWQIPKDATKENS